jgi:hypothetical protein
MVPVFVLILFLLFLFVLKILLKLVEARVPEPFVLVDPSSDLAKRFTTKRYEDFATLFPAFNESGSFE